MTQTLTLLAANMILVVVFMATTAVIHWLVARRPLFVWMMVALALGGLDLVLSVAVAEPGPPWTALGIMLNVACACALAKAALSHCAHARRVPFTILPALLFGLVAAALSLTGHSYVASALLLQLAAAIPLAEAAWCFARGGRPLERATALVLAIGAANFILRVPILLIWFGWEASREQVFATPLMAISLYAVTFLLPIAFGLMTALVVTGVLEEYRLKSERDGMTGIANRETCEARFAESNRHGGVLVIADIDRFKQINDRHGHAVGDRTICLFARLLQETGLDCGRIGGEEFALFLPHATAASGRLVAEGLRTAFALQDIEAPSGAFTATASFGVSVCAPAEPYSAAAERADRALYEAKAAGRDRVVMARAVERLAA